MPQNQNHSPFIDILEHDDYSSPETKRVQMYGWDSTNLQKVRLGINSDGSLTTPIPTADTNPSYVLTRNGAGYITNIAQTIGATTYNKVITRDGSNYITDISVWS